jgi:hypothetical protein
MRSFRISLSETRSENQNGETSMTGKQEQSIASTLAFGILGAALVYYGRRANPGFLTTVASTAGYGLVTKAVSAAVFAALAPSSS